MSRLIEISIYRTLWLFSVCRLLIILSVEVLEKTHERIGDPQPPSSAPGRKATSPMATGAAVAGPNVSTGPLTEPSCYGSKRVTGSTSTMRVKIESAGTVPISALNPYMSKWTIKARVTAKSETRTYTNARGEGKVFSFDLLDAENGEIRASCFNRDVDTFYDTITVSCPLGFLHRASSAFARSIEQIASVCKERTGYCLRHECLICHCPNNMFHVTT